MRRTLAGFLLVASALGGGLLLAASAGAEPGCQDVWVREGGGGQVRKRTVCDDAPARNDVDWRLRELERRERRREREEMEQRQRRGGPVIILQPIEGD